MIRVHFTYRHVDKPWGGANNFIRALRQELQKSGNFTFTDDPEEPCDVIFMNQLGTGPAGNGKIFSVKQVKRLCDQGRKLVVRAVNLNWHAFRLGPRNLIQGWWRDRQTIELLNLADVAIFQSEYQRQFFIRSGFKGKQSVVIHNGAPPEFWLDRPAAVPENGLLRLISSTASARQTKRHDLIARISLCEGVEIFHMGAWPKGLAKGRVQLLGMQPRERIIELMTDSHFFLHAAVKDPCPNAIFEAVCAGLPVIYNPGPGSSAEIVGPCGIALDEENLDKVLALSRERLQDLRQAVLDHRQEFTIGHAASMYRREFERCIG